jgi:hypothetical protein
MTQPVEYMPAASLVSLAVLCVLGLRRLVLMPGLHALRVVLLTALLWAAVVYLFALACRDMFTTGCDYIDFQSDHYTCTEP